MSRVVHALYCRPLLRPDLEGQPIGLYEEKEAAIAELDKIAPNNTLRLRGYNWHVYLKERKVEGLFEEFRAALADKRELVLVFPK